MVLPLHGTGTKKIFKSKSIPSLSPFSCHLCQNMHKHIRFVVLSQPLSFVANIKANPLVLNPLGANLFIGNLALLRVKANQCTHTHTRVLQRVAILVQPTAFTETASCFLWKTRWQDNMPCLLMLLYLWGLLCKGTKHVGGWGRVWSGYVQSIFHSPCRMEGKCPAIWGCLLGGHIPPMYSVCMCVFLACKPHGGGRHMDWLLLKRKVELHSVTDTCPVAGRMKGKNQ